MKTFAIEAAIDMLAEVLGSKYLVIITDAKEELAALQNAAQQSVQADGNCPYCQYPSFDEGGKLLDHCAACSRPRR